jgi:hypothetical protein
LTWDPREVTEVERWWPWVPRKNSVVILAPSPASISRKLYLAKIVWVDTSVVRKLESTFKLGELL